MSKWIAIASVGACLALAACSTHTTMNADAHWPIIYRASQDCRYNEESLLALQYEAFDQQPNGWRALANMQGCLRTAASLIATWRDRRAETLPPDQMQVLWWHEGQVLASAGDYEAAIGRLETSRTFHNDRPPPPDASPEAAENWRANIAVRDAWEDATLAFLRRDRAAFDEAYARLLAVPEPPGFADLEALMMERTGVRMSWPLNIESTELMRACWNSLYGVDCRRQTSD